MPEMPVMGVQEVVVVKKVVRLVKVLLVKGMMEWLVPVSPEVVVVLVLPLLTKMVELEKLMIFVLVLMFITPEVAAVVTLAQVVQVAELPAPTAAPILLIQEQLIPAEEVVVLVVRLLAALAVQES